MTLLGILSILQITLLPGLIFTQIFPVGRLLTRIILSFCLSLIFNYQFVFLFTILGLYTRTSVLILFVIEILLLFFIYAKKISLGARGQEQSFQNPDSGSAVLDDSVTRILKYIFIGTGLFIFLVFFLKTLKENPGIFDSWDDVFSWNHWASEWYSGYLPLKTYHYPQLLPTNWSISYQFLGTDEIQFFAKSVMVLFGFGILFIFWDLYAKSKSVYFLMALTISGFLIQKIVGAYFGKGYVDIPVAFFSLAVFYVFYLGLNGYMSVNLSMGVMAIVLSGALLTKQSGIFMTISFFVMSWYLLKRTNYSNKRKWMLFGLSILICLLSAAPWYVYKQVQMQTGVEKSEVSWVTKDIYAGKTISQRGVDATNHFSEKICNFDFLKKFSDHKKVVIQYSVFVFFLLLALLSVFSFYGRMALILVVIPYYLLWAFFFSYDLRNVTLLLPFLGLSMAIGTLVLLKYVLRWIPTLHLPKTNIWYGILLMAILVLAVISVKYDKQYLLQKEAEQARLLMGDSTLNTRLYDLYYSKQLKGKILSGYEFLKYLPGVKQYYMGLHFEKENLDSLKTIYLKNRADHKIEYFIFNENAPLEILDFVSQKEKEGELKLYFRSDAGWHMEEILEGNKN
jgi:hypothetical protein